VSAIQRPSASVNALRFSGARASRRITTTQCPRRSSHETFFLADLAADLNDLISVGVGVLPIPTGRRDCTLTALQAAVLALSQTTLESSPTIAAQTAFVAFITAA